MGWRAIDRVVSNPNSVPQSNSRLHDGDKRCASIGRRRLLASDNR
jgi:hypothetical protein